MSCIQPVKTAKHVYFIFIIHALITNVISKNSIFYGQTTKHRQNGCCLEKTLDVLNY